MVEQVPPLFFFFFFFTLKPRVAAGSSCSPVGWLRAQSAGWCTENRGCGSDEDAVQVFEIDEQLLTLLTPTLLTFLRPS